MAEENQPLDPIVLHEISWFQNRLAGFEGQWRIRDVDLGERLGLKRPTDIRYTIERNRTELESYGIIHCERIIHEAAGRPSDEYWLNYRQALAVCQLSKAERAEIVRRALVEVFAAVTEGSYVPAAYVRDLLPEKVGQLEAHIGRVEDIVSGHTVVLAQIGTDLTEVKDSTRILVEKARRERQDISPEVKKAHRQAIRSLLGGKCPCCMKTLIVDDNYEVVGNAEGDHFHARHERDFEDTWIICQECHRARTRKQKPRAIFQAAFSHYQAIAEEFAPKGKKKIIIAPHQQRRLF